MKRKVAALALSVVFAGALAGSAFAEENGPPPPPEELNCNSGRGNGSEGNPSQLLVPGTDTGSGIAPTVDCDPGNSGGQNSGGD
jgi:hypothetical protein